MHEADWTQRGVHPGAGAGRSFSALAPFTTVRASPGVFSLLTLNKTEYSRVVERVGFSVGLNVADTILVRYYHKLGLL